MLFRIITVRAHKNIVFCDSFDNNYNKIQLTFSQEMFKSSNVKVGSVIEAEYILMKNKRGDDLYQITRINNVNDHKKNISYKSINNLSIPSYQSNLTNALNGGINLKYWIFRQRLIEEIRNFLISKSYLEVSTPPLMNSRGTSLVNPMRVNSKYNGEKYLKITHELELKKICYITLKSLFEIGYVTRDVYTTSKSANQFLTLELVSPTIDELSAEEFYIKVYEFAINLAKEYNIQYDELFDNIEVCDVLKAYLSKHSKFDKQEFITYYKELLLEIRNMLFINAPIETPLAEPSEYGIALETKWAIGPRGIGHGYTDESDYQAIEQAFKKQIELLTAKGIQAELDKDYLKILEYAGIPTKSLNLGIDRFMHKFLGLDNEEKAVRILGI